MQPPRVPGRNVARVTSAPTESCHVSAAASWAASYPRSPYSQAADSARTTKRLSNREPHDVGSLTGELALSPSPTPLGQHTQCGPSTRALQQLSAIGHRSRHRIIDVQRLQLREHLTEYVWLSSFNFSHAKWRSPGM